MTERDRLATLLAGGVPDVPPHWELVFQISKAMFGMDPAPRIERAGDSEAARADAWLGFHDEVCERLLTELGWAALPPANAYDAHAVRRTRERFGDLALVPGYDGGGVFYMLSGTEVMDFVVRLFERPEELRAEARQKCDGAKEQLRRLADAGADFFVLTYDFGFNDQPFVSPEDFAWLVTPYLTELVAAAHELGKPAILHSDGCITRILDQIHGTGIDGYQSVDPQGHMDIREVRAQYPDWLLMGNVNCSMMQDGPEERIRESVRYAMEYGGIGRRFMLSTSNCIFDGMPPEHYRIMLDEFRVLREATLAG